MSVYIVISLTLHLMVIICRMILLISVEWPRKRSDESMGENVLNILICAGFAFWAGMLLAKDMLLAGGGE